MRAAEVPAVRLQSHKDKMQAMVPEGTRRMEALTAVQVQAKVPQALEVQVLLVETVVMTTAKEIKIRKTRRRRKRKTKRKNEEARRKRRTRRTLILVIAAGATRVTMTRHLPAAGAAAGPAATLREAAVQHQPRKPRVHTTTSVAPRSECQTKLQRLPISLWARLTCLASNACRLQGTQSEFRFPNTTSGRS